MTTATKSTRNLINNVKHFAKTNIGAGGVPVTDEYIAKLRTELADRLAALEAEFHTGLTAEQVLDRRDAAAVLNIAI